MSQETHIVGTNGKGEVLEVDLHPFETRSGGHVGLVALVHPLVELEPNTVFFLNESFGNAMNQDVSFGGVGLRATVMHAGVNSGTADSGTIDGGPTAFKLIQSGQNFQTTVGPGALVHNTVQNTYAQVVTVDSDTQLTLDTDIMDVGSQAYEINHIWTGTATQGTWNFADSGKITITSASDNDEAIFNEDAVHIWNMSPFTAITGKVDLDIFNGLQHTIVFEIGLDGITVGNSIDLNDYIDTTNFLEQSFAIPKADLGLTTQDVNSLKISILRPGGVKPTIKFDDLQLENEGNPATFSVNVATTDKFHIDELVFAYKDNIDSFTTGLADVTENATNPFLDTGAILGVSSLPIGFVIKRVRKGETTFSATIHNLGQHISAGAEMSELVSDGTNTFLTLRAKFKNPLIIDGGKEDSLTVTINDNMSGLIQFTAAARGGLEVLEEI